MDPVAWLVVIVLVIIGSLFFDVAKLERQMKKLKKKVKNTEEGFSTRDKAKRDAS